LANVNVMQSKTHVSEVNTGIEVKDRKKLAASLSRALAETYVLYLKTQGFHWNVVGPLFYGMHKLTEAQYEDLAEAVDALAERIRALGHPAPATFAEFLKLSKIKEMSGAPSAEDSISSDRRPRDHQPDVPRGRAGCGR
jgi:starvation-inducible DNA-binding protein